MTDEQKQHMAEMLAEYLPVYATIKSHWLPHELNFTLPIVKDQRPGTFSFQKQWRWDGLGVHRTELCRVTGMTSDGLAALEAAFVASRAMWTLNVVAVDEEPVGPKRQRRRKDRRGFRRLSTTIYIFRAEDGRYKIGVTVDVEHRRKTIQNASGLATEVVYSKRYRDPFPEEQRLHALFAGYRREGEWFEIPHDHPELTALIGIPLA